MWKAFIRQSEGSLKGIPAVAILLQKSVKPAAWGWHVQGLPQSGVNQTHPGQRFKFLLLFGTNEQYSLCPLSPSPRPLPLSLTATLLMVM